jgi:phage-related protein
MLNAFIKKTRATPTGELDTARRRMKLVRDD